MEKFEVIQFSRFTEIEVNLDDKHKLEEALYDLEIGYRILGSEGFHIRTHHKQGYTALRFIKGRIIPKRIHGKPKTAKKAVYDLNIITGFEGCLITGCRFEYKQI